MSLRISENKSAFVQKIKGKEAISSPREVGHTLTTRQNCPLFAMYALNLQEGLFQHEKPASDVSK